MNVTYFHRNSKGGYSIAKVSKTFISRFKNNLNVVEHEVPHFRADFLSVFRNIYYVFLNREKNGVNHITGDIHYCALGLIGCKTVLTVHDLTVFENEGNFLKKIFKKIIWFKLPIFFVDKIICISEETKRKLQQIVKRSDILVISNAVDPSFKYCSKEFNSIHPVILQIGTAWNKNIKNLISALYDIECKLIIIGSVEKDIQSILNKTIKSYEIKADLSDKEIINQYENSDIVAFVSLYEGFGMPIVEANAVGRAVITSNIQPMCDIANDSALLVNPNDIEAIRTGILKIINDKKYREKIIANGILNIKKYDIELIYKQYMSVYESLNKTNKI